MRVNQHLQPENSTVTIVGGGLAGLVGAILLAREGISVKVIEKKRYPFHRVCGEYISNETLPFLKANGLYPESYAPPVITEFQLTSVNAKEARIMLDLGGFGISRFAFDHWLYQVAVAAGVTFDLDTEVIEIRYSDDLFHVTTTASTFSSPLVIGAHGKRSRVDLQLQRNFVHRRSPWVGVKYHVKVNHPSSLIALHNFEDGYCGISNVEDGISNLCYLVHRDQVRKHGSIGQLEKHVLFQNPWLKRIFTEAEFVFTRPEVINEISFETKQPVHQHLLMLGDAAGMITPLCGNGMAMAIRSAAIASQHVIRFMRNQITRDDMESGYAADWNQNFSRRLWTGRQVQRLFGSTTTSNIAVWIANNVKPLSRSLVKATHGAPFG